MAYERSQMMIQQAGYFIPQPRLGIVPTIPNSITGNIQSSCYSRDNYSYQHLSPYTADVHEKDYEVITYEDLEKMLPDPKPNSRAELGILPNGRAYAPKTASRENYLLFPSKPSYILYFIHHYFSRENISRDHTFVKMLLNHQTLPLERLVKFPRLAALNTTMEEAESAIANSKIVQIEELGVGIKCVRRIDGFPASSVWLIDENSISNVLDPTVPQNVYWGGQTRLHSDHQTAVENEIKNESSHQNIEINNLATKTGALNLGSDKNAQSNEPGNGHVIPMLDQIPETSVDNGSSRSNSNTSTSYVNQMDSTSWVQQQSAKQMMHAPEDVTSAASFVFNNYSSPMGLNQRTNYPIQHNINPELQNIAFLPMRQPNPNIPQYFVGQSAYFQNNYPATLGYQHGNSPPNLNLNMAAALASLNALSTPNESHTQQNIPTHLPAYHSNNFIGTHPGQFNPNVIGQHHPSTLFAAANHYQAAALAAMTAIAQQQNANAPYMQHQNPLPNPSVSVPFYYTQQLPLQSSVQRNSFHRLPHNALYPIPTFAYQPMPNTANYDTRESGAKLDVGQNYAANFQQVPANFGYPLLIQPQVHFQHSKSTSLSSLAATAAGLQIHCSQPSRSFGIAPLNVAIVNPTSSNGNTNIANNNTSKSLSSTSTAISENKASDKFKPEHNLEKDINKTSNDSLKAKKLSPSLENLNIDYTSTNTNIAANNTNSGLSSANDATKQYDRSKITSPASVDDSEDSTSSGIGEMTATSTGGSEKRASSSGTLTEQVDNKFNFDLPTQISKLFKETLH